MLQQLESGSDQTAGELLAQFQARYPDRYRRGHLRTVQRRLRIWRQQAVQRLICDMEDMTADLGYHSGAVPLKART